MLLLPGVFVRGTLSHLHTGSVSDSKGPREDFPSAHPFRKRSIRSESHAGAGVVLLLTAPDPQMQGTDSFSAEIRVCP